MLTHLTIENFAIIDRVDLELSSGLVALTGETGAGKSIIIDAVGGLLGNRLNVDAIRTGAAQARVEGIFDRPNQPDLAATLTELGVAEDEDSLIVSREISRNGRNVARVNGRAVTLGALQKIGRFLLDLHGQGDHLALLRVPEHVRLLDGFAGLTGRQAELRGLADAVHRIRAELKSFAQDQREIARRVDLLRFQLNEITSVELIEGEEDRLRQERSVLMNAEKIAVGIDEIRRLLAEADQAAALDSLGDASSRLADLSRLDPTLTDESQVLDAAIDQITEVAQHLRRYRDTMEFSASRLEIVEDRLNVIRGLERKYGSSIADVLAFAAQAREELDKLENREERAAELAVKESEAVAEFADAAVKVSAARREAAAGLEMAIERELAELNMVGARFQVMIAQEDDPDGVVLPDGRRVQFDGTGIDRVEFFISPNPGEDVKPLVRVVSGGETARLMLSLKTILASADEVPTLIFDEVDAGIGGQTAVVVGRKIANLARERQILCVTHLPQIAAFADQHLSVRKASIDGRTRTDVRHLETEDRVAEIAGMIGGDVGRTTADAHAREALATSEAWKAKHLMVGGGIS